MPAWREASCYTRQRASGVVSNEGLGDFNLNQL
jgi:hypothetical protein